MTFKQLQYILILSQYSSISPFKYNINTHIFERSRFFQIYSIILASSITLCAIISTYTWLSFSLSLTNIYNIVDLLCLALSWTMNIFVGCLVLNDKFFHLDEFCELANSLLKIEKIAKAQNSKFLKNVIIHATFEIIIFPTLMMALNATFFYVSLKKIKPTIICLMISLCTLWTHMSIFPLQILFKYLELVLKKINDSLRNFKKQSEKVTNTIDQYSGVYIKIQQILNFISYRYGPHTVIFFLSVNFITVWQIYRGIDMIFLKIVPIKGQTLYITYVFYACNALMSIKNALLLVRSITSLLHENQNLKTNLHHLLHNSNLKIEIREQVGTKQNNILTTPQ